MLGVRSAGCQGCLGLPGFFSFNPNEAGSTIFRHYDWKLFESALVRVRADYPYFFPKSLELGYAARRGTTR